MNRLNQIREASLDSLLLHSPKPRAFANETELYQCQQLGKMTLLDVRIGKEWLPRGIGMRVTGRNLLRTVGGEEVTTFVPDALPPRAPPIEVDGKRAPLLARAEQALAR